jgi:hypothetical protein
LATSSFEVAGSLEVELPEGRGDGVTDRGAEGFAGGGGGAEGFAGGGGGADL